MSDYVLLMGGVGLVKGRVRGLGAVLASESAVLSEHLRKAGWPADAPFERVSLMLRYGHTASEEVHIGRTNAHHELEVAVQASLAELQRADELQQTVRSYAVLALNAVARKFALSKAFGLPTTGQPV